MPDQPNFELNVGLSEEEKNDLEQMIVEFQKERTSDEPSDDLATLRHHIDTISNQMEYLTNMFLALDRRVKPLYETIRLTYHKSEILNQRINTLIHSIRTGEPL